MPEHAILSPSSAECWLECTPSARVRAALPDRTSTYADEGGLAHRLGELLLNRKLRRIREADYLIILKEIQANEFYSQSMLDYCEDYSVYVLQVFNRVRKKNPNAMIFIETWLDMKTYVPEGFGTADVLIVCDGWIYFIDLKYGKGIPVSAVDNKQLMLYALGAYDLFRLLFNDIENISLTIYQPRLDNISTFEMALVNLLVWANGELKEKAKLAYDGKGEFKPGDHCQFCEAKPTCRANEKFRMSLAKYAFKEPELLNPQEIADVLTKYRGLVSWAKSVEEYALGEAVKGKPVPGWKLVAGRSDRYISDIKKAVAILTKAGYTKEELYKNELKGLTELETLIGKKDFNAHLHTIIEKPYGKPTLVPDTDKRPVYNRSKGAKNIFK